MDGFNVVGVTAISYHGFGVLINIISKDDIVYRVIIGDIPQCTCLDFTKCKLNLWEEKGNECITNFFIMCLDFLQGGL